MPIRFQRFCLEDKVELSCGRLEGRDGGEWGCHCIDPGARMADSGLELSGGLI